MKTDVQKEYEKFADPRAKYVGHVVYRDGLSLTYQVDGCPTPSKCYFTFDDRYTLGDAAQEIGKLVLTDAA